MVSKAKTFYESPISKTIEIRMEGIIADSNNNTETPVDGGDENF